VDSDEHPRSTGTQRDLRRRLVRRSVGQRAARRMAADVDGLLVTIERW